MNAKKLMSLLTAICLIVSCFAGVVSAEEVPAKTPITINTLDPASETVTFNGVTEGDDVSVDFSKIEMELYKEKISTEVGKANVCEFPYDAEAEKVYDDYNVTYNKEENVIYIEMTDLKPHKNEPGTVAFWTGFTVKAPEGAAEFDYKLYTPSYWGYDYFSGDRIEKLETIDAKDPETEEDDVKGVAFYFDANAENPVCYVEVQWFDADGNAVSDLEYAWVDISGVECYEVKGKVVNANVRDSFEEGEVCKNYSATEENGVVTIKADDLKMHTNGAEPAKEGYWTGFAVTAPTGAAKFDYIIDGLYQSRGSIDKLETIDAKNPETENDDVEGVAFYLDAERAEYDYSNGKRYFDVSLQWRDADGNVLSARTDYYVDVTDVELYELVGTVVPANVRDYHGDYDVYADYEVEKDPKSNVVKISMVDLLMHKSSDENGNAPAFWTGFAVTAPIDENEDIATFNYTINGYGHDAVALETIDAKNPETEDDDVKGVAFYLDMENALSSGSKKYFDVSLQWCDAEGNPLSAWKEYYVDVTDVNCKYFDRSGIAAAKLKDHADTPETELYEAGTYKAEIVRGNTVEISAKGLKKHTNNDPDDKKEGYWVGFSLVAPKDATKFEYLFNGHSSYNRVEWLDAGATEAPEDDVYGAAFYVDASDFDAPDYATIMWYREDGTPYDGITYYYNIDTTNVELAIENEFDVDATIAAAPISDNDIPANTELYTEGSYSATLDEDGKTIKIAADKLHAHKNRDGKGVRGAWVGVEFTDAPAGAEYAKFAFTPGYSWDDYENVIDLDEEDARFYVNVFDADTKDTVWIQYFGADDKALTNIKKYTINTDAVTLYYATEDGKPADVKIGTEVAPAAHWEWDEDKGEYVVTDRVVSYGNSTVAEKNGKITLGADQLFIHDNQEGNSGAWIGFSTKVDDAAYVRYAFRNSDEYYISWDGAGRYESEIYDTDGTEYFYVDASDHYWSKDNLKVQFFNADGEALTDIVEYDIDIEAVDYSDVFDFPVLSKGIALTGADAEKYELVYDGIENIADNQFVDWKSTLKYVYADVEVYGNGSVTNNGKVWIRDTDYSDGIKTNSLTAKAAEGYKFHCWYTDPWSYEETITIDQDKCYNLYAEFVDESYGSDDDSDTTTKPSGNGGGGNGGLQAGGDKSNAGADDLGQKDEDKTEGTVAPSAPVFFVDVPASAWYYDVVKSAYDNGLMNGVSATTFAPTQSLTRGMFVTILYRLAGSPAVEAAASFIDVPANQYYADAVAWASANSIVNGVSADKFAPNANITREQMATIIHRYATANNIEAANGNEVSYSDSAKISEFAKAAVEWASSAGVLSGNSDGTFAPLRTAIRAEAAAIFVRLLGLVK